MNDFAFHRPVSRPLLVNSLDKLIHDEYNSHLHLAEQTYHHG